MEQADKKSFFIIACFSLLLFLPAFLWGARGHDLHCQSLWVKAFSEQFWKGDIYPRWLMDMYAGNGSPVFFYYPPFAYYVSAVFYKILPQDYFSYLPIAASSLGATLLSGISFYVWIRRETTGNQALLGSLLYMAIPFHVGLSFYHILLYSTMWAFAWLPLLLLFARRIGGEERGGVTGFALALGLLALTNIPSLIIGVPLAIAYGTIYCKKERLPSAAMQVTLAMILGLGLAMISLLPAIAYMKYTLVDFHWTNPGNNSFKDMLHLGFEGSQQAVYTCVWLLQLVALLIYSAIAWGKNNKAGELFICASILALILALPICEALWANSFILKVLQHPARLFIIPTLAIPVLAARAEGKYRYITWGLLALSCFCVAEIAYTTRTTPEKFAQENPLGYKQYQLGIDQYSNYLSSPGLLKIYYDKNKISALDTSNKGWLADGDATFNITKWQPRDIVFEYSAAHSSHLRIRQMFFPGWQAYMDGKPLDTGWDEPTGQVVISLPPGSGVVELRLLPLWPEITGKLISMLSAFILMLIYLIQMRKTAVKT